MVDAVGAIIAFASLMVGSYALVFLLAALRDGHDGAVRQNAVMLVALAVANGTVDGVRRWRRHHG